MPGKYRPRQGRVQDWNGRAMFDRRVVLRLTLKGLQESLRPVIAEKAEKERENYRVPGISTLHSWEDTGVAPPEWILGPLAKCLGCRQKDLKKRKVDGK